MPSKWIRKRRKERRRMRTTRFGKVIVVSELGPPCHRCKQSHPGQGTPGIRRAAAAGKVLFRSLVSLHE